MPNSLGSARGAEQDASIHTCKAEVITIPNVFLIAFMLAWIREMIVTMSDARKMMARRRLRGRSSLSTLMVRSGRETIIKSKMVGT